MLYYTKEKKDIEHNIFPLLRKRWSPRSFDEREVEEETLQRLFEAARWAPSSYNEQPWYFIYAHKKDKEEFQKILDCLVEFNQQWVKDAPVVMLAVASTHFKKNDKPNPHAKHDIGQALAYLTLQATHDGIYVHQMAGFDGEKAKEIFDIKGNYEPVTAVALGYIGESDSLPEDLEKKEHTSQKRKPQEQFVFQGKWEDPSDQK